ncbi:MAG: class I SAM-dependent methyltransferase [Variovorax sp.]
MTPLPSTGAKGAALQAPHAPLPAYYGNEKEHRDFLQRIFDSTAPDYERIERVLALGTGARYRRMALQRAGLSSCADVLDVGIGTGLVAREALKLIGASGHLVGVDPSPGMMSHVNSAQVELVQGFAEALPRPDASSDFVSMGYAMRHIGDVAATFSEFHRVLRPGGSFVVLEITRPQGRIARMLLKGYMRAVVPLIARVITGRGDTVELWRYYWDTIEACIAPAAVMQALRDAGFTDVRHHVEVGIFSEYTGRKPA